MIRKVGYPLTVVGVVWLVAALNMETSVLTPLRTNEFGIWDGQLPSRVENIGLIARRENHIIVASLLTLVGILLILFGGNRGWQSTSEDSPEGVGYAEPPATRDLGDDEYRLWLAERYSITRNDLFDAYVVARKTFPDLASALSHAHSLELEDAQRRQVATEIAAEDEEAQRERRAENWSLKKNLARATAVGIALIVTGGALFFLSHDETVDDQKEGSAPAEIAENQGSDRATVSPTSRNNVFEQETDTVATPSNSQVANRHEGTSSETIWTQVQRSLIARWETEMSNCDPASDAFDEVEAACARLDLVEQEMREGDICTQPVPDSDAVVLVRCG